MEHPPSVAMPTTSDRSRVSAPHAVDPDKDLEYKTQKMATITMMYKQVLEEYEKMKQDYQRNPSDQIHLRLEVKQQMLRRVEEELRNLRASQGYAGDRPQSVSSDVGSNSTLKLHRKTEPHEGPLHTYSSEPFHVPKGLPPLPKNHGSWAPSGPKHRKTESLPDTSYRTEYGTSPGSVTPQDISSLSPEVEYPPDDIGRKMTSSLPSTTETAEESTQESHSQGASPKLRSKFSDTGQPTDPDMSPPVVEPENSNQSTLERIAQKKHLQVISPHQVKVVTMDDSDFSTVEDHGVFNDMGQLKDRPAHLAVFLHYLLSNSDCSPLLFFLVTDAYSQGNVRKMRKWAYEIYSTFLADKAPLKLSMEESMVTGVETVLQTKYDKDDVMKTVFVSARSAALHDIADLLSDYRSKRALGLGNIYGDQDLRDCLDRQTEMKIVDKTLWRHFERLRDDTSSDRSQALAFCLATFFKQVGYSTWRNVSQLENFPSFNAKDKKMFKFTKATKKGHLFKGHQFVAQQYYCATYCQQCQGLLWGIGNQGFQCANCDLNTHKDCFQKVKDHCTESIKKRKQPSMLNKLISRKNSSNSPTAIKEAQQLHQQEDLSTPSPTTNPRLGLPEETEESDTQSLNRFSHIECPDDPGRLSEDLKSSPSPSRQRTPAPESADSLSQRSYPASNLGRSESLNQRGDTRANVRRAHSDVRADEHATKTLNQSGSSSNSSLSAKSQDSPNQSNEGLTETTTRSLSFIHKLQMNDSDLEIESELPPLESVLSRDILRKLKPKEKKKQDVINELFFTERAHVRNLKVMRHFFYQPMKDEPWISNDLVALLFPNIDEIIDVHSVLNKQMKSKRKENAVVEDFAQILVQRFSGEEGERFMSAAAKFCQNQSHALESLRQKQKKDPKFAAFLQDAAGNPLCRRLELKDLIPTEMQRLTKYPLLIENLLKYTQINTEEHRLLSRAHELSKNILNQVNQQVQECENHQRLVEIQRRLDRRPVENSTHPVLVEYKKLDLTQRVLIHDSPLTWRLSRTKLLDLHALLFEDILVLLQKQDDKFVLRCQSTTMVAGKEDTKLTHSPIIKLTNLLTRSVATDKRAFFLVSTSNVGPQIYELVAGARDEKNRWIKYITDATEAHKNKETSHGAKSATVPPETPASEPSGLLDEKTAGDDSDVRSEDVLHGNHSNSSDSMDTLGCAEVKQTEQLALVQPNEVVVSRTVCIEKAESVRKSAIDCLKEKNLLVENTLREKKRLVAEILQVPLEDYDHIVEMSEELSEKKDARELILGSVTQVDSLTRLINEQLKPDTCRSSSDDTSSPGSVVSAAGQQQMSLLLPASQLLSISSHLHRDLLQLMQLMVQQEQTQPVVQRLTDSRLTVNSRSHSSSLSQTSRPQSFVSTESFASEATEDTDHEFSTLPSVSDLCLSLGSVEVCRPHVTSVEHVSMSVIPAETELSDGVRCVEPSIH